MRNAGPASDVDEDLLGCQDFGAHGDFMGRDEAGVVLVDSAIFQIPEPMFDAGSGLPGYLILASFHALHVDVDGARNVDAVIGGAAREVRCVGAGHQRLGGDAAGVYTGAPEEFALDDGDPHPAAGQAPGQ